MNAIYSAIAEEFEDELSSLRELVESSQNMSVVAKTRVASVRASTLLLAATFEEFVREMALERATDIVSKAESLEDLPDKLVEAAWKRTLDDIVRTKVEGESKKMTLALTARSARPRFESVCKFVEGDIAQNIFKNLVHNENNMRPGEINRLFAIGGVSDVCLKVCKRRALKIFFGERQQGRTHGAWISGLNGFMDKRNHIAHTPNLKSSDAPEEIFRDIDMLAAFCKDLEVTLNSL